MKKIAYALVLFSILQSGSVFAQQMPAPRAMPRTPVNRETVMEPRDPMPASRQLQGLAAIIDGEKLRIGDTDLRLFGVVPPQLSASFGPQARATLDTLANGQNVNCQIRDRDRDGRLLATCHNASGNDMALELLKRGLAVAARGSVAGTELASPYMAAEQLAQSEKIGLWSVTVAIPAASSTSKQESAAMPASAEPKKDEKVAPRTDKSATTDAQLQAKITADLNAQQQSQSRIDDAAWSQNDGAGFFERYQILIAGFLMLATALSITGALWAQKRRDRLDETRAIAAALRGELMAARGVCLGRAKEIKDESEDRSSTWPRIRATLYQAYVGRLGLLGAELARHVASIYGQSSDYAALYNPNGTTHDAPKKQALEGLSKRIDEILPRLAEIERTGRLPFATPVYMHPPAAVRAGQPLPPAAEMVKEPSTQIAAVAEHSPIEAGQISNVVRAPTALWENVRGFLQGHRAAVEQETSPISADPHVTEYAAMIEADMAQYNYNENVESIDVSPKIKSG